MKFLGRKNKIDCLISEVCWRLKNTYTSLEGQVPKRKGKIKGDFAGKLNEKIMQCK